MAKRLKRPRDPVQLGKLIGDILTGQIKDAAQAKVTPKLWEMSDMVKVLDDGKSSDLEDHASDGARRRLAIKLYHYPKIGVPAGSL